MRKFSYLVAVCFIYVSPAVAQIKHTADDGTRIELESYESISHTVESEQNTQTLNTQADLHSTKSSLVTVSKYSLIISGILGLSILQATLSNYFAGNPIATSAINFAITPINIALSSFILSPWQDKLSHFLHSGMHDDKNQPSEKEKIKEKTLEKQWYKTNATYSMNEQMSRNIRSLFFNTIGLHLDSLQKAMTQKNAQECEAIVLRINLLLSNLFRDIDCGHPEIIEFGRSYFKNLASIAISQDLLNFVETNDSISPVNSELILNWINLEHTYNLN